MSPQLLQTNSPWYGVLRHIASKYFLCLIRIDEAHTMQQDSFFWPEYKLAVGTISYLHGLLSVGCSIIVMLATFKQVDQDRINNNSYWQAIFHGNVVKVITLTNSLRRSVLRESHFICYFINQTEC